MPDSRTGRAYQRRMSIEDTGVLEQRVYTIEKTITDQAAQTAQQISNLAQQTSQQISAVTQSMNQQISGLAQQIGNLGTKLEERAKIPWPALAVMLSFLVVIGGLVWYPISDNLREARTIQKEMQADIRENYVTVREFTGRIGALQTARDSQANGIIERVSRLEVQVKDNALGIVPRGEHAEKWNAQRDRDADLQRQVDTLKKEFGELYSPRDALKTLQERINDLERQLRGDLIMKSNR